MITTIIFFYLAIKNSVGNVVEIMDALSVDSQSEQAANLVMLKEKWGTWIIGDGAVILQFVDIRNALFSGLMITFTILTVVFLLLAIIIGKILLPMLAKMYKDNNDELVDIATLKTLEGVNTLTGKKSKNKKPKKEWF